MNQSMNQSIHQLIEMHGEDERTSGISVCHATVCWNLASPVAFFALRGAEMRNVCVCDYGGAYEKSLRFMNGPFEG